MTNLEIHIMKLNNDLQINKLKIESLLRDKEDNLKQEIDTKIIDDEIASLEFKNIKLLEDIEKYSNQ